MYDSNVIYYVHNVVQPSPLSSSKTFSSPQNKTPYPLRSHFRFPPPPSPWQPPVCFLTFWIYLFQIFHTKEIILYYLCIWLLSFGITFLRFIHIVACTSISFFLRLHNIPSYEYTTICLSIHLQMDVCVVSTSWQL